MEFSEEQVGDVIVVRLKGRLDSSTAQPVREKFLRLPTGRYPHIAIDLSKVDFISSAGLQALLVLAKKVQQSKGKVVLFGLEPNIKEVLSISGLDKIFTVRLDNDSALAVLKGYQLKSLSRRRKPMAVLNLICREQLFPRRDYQRKFCAAGR